MFLHKQDLRALVYYIAYINNQALIGILIVVGILLVLINIDLTDFDRLLQGTLPGVPLTERPLGSSSVNCFCSLLLIVRLSLFLLLFV